MSRVTKFLSNKPKLLTYGAIITRAAIGAVSIGRAEQVAEAGMSKQDQVDLG